MSQWKPCKRRNFIRKLKRLGFEGAFSGTRHQFMTYKQHRLTIPANAEYSIPQLRMMIREVETIIDRKITSDEWNNLQWITLVNRYRPKKQDFPQRKLTSPSRGSGVKKPNQPKRNN